jgi:hypothetical protein
VDHARLEKNVLSRDAGRWLTCCWDECENRSVSVHLAVVHDHARGLACDHPDSQHVRYTFCTDRHKLYWVNGHRSYGNLPSGDKLRVW